MFCTGWFSRTDFNKRYVMFSSSAKKVIFKFFLYRLFSTWSVAFFVTILSCFCLSSPWISIFIYLGFFMSARSWPWTVGPTAQIFWPFDFVFHHFLTSWHFVDLTRIMNQKVFTLLPAKICFETEGVDLRRYFKYLNNYFASHPF